VAMTLPRAAPMIVPAAPKVERRKADDTAANAPPAVVRQSISNFLGGYEVIVVQYADRSVASGEPCAGL
jgi:hypothetical protein